MTYLSPHVYHIICRIPEDASESAVKENDYEERTVAIDHLAINYDGDNERKTAYLRYAKNLWKDTLNYDWNEDSHLVNSRAVQYIRWTGCADLISELMNLPTEFTNLVILKLTVIIERSLGNVLVTIANSRCPSLLKDLLNSDVLRKFFGDSLMTAFETLMGPPTSLNLRNVLWHGFPMLGEIKSQYCRILVKHIIALGRVLEEKQIRSIKHRPKLAIPNTDLVKDCFPLMNRKDILFKLFKSTAFIPLGMAPAWKLAVELFFSGRYADAVILFLPQLEHALRCLFAVVNRCPHRQITADSDTLYTTFDEILAKDIESHTPNRLLPEIGSNVCEMLYDVLYFPEGFRLRDRLSHGEYDFDHVNDVIANHVICIGLCLCIKYLFPWRQNLKTETEILAKVVRSMGSYRSLYHPIPLLMREVSIALDRTEAVMGVTETAEAACNVEAGKNRLLDIFKDIFIRFIFLHTSFVDINSDYNHSSLVTLIRKLIILKRDVMHRPKSEIEIIGILRKITKQVHAASEQVIYSANEKRIQFENRTLRSRARNNYMNMLTVVPILTSCWLSLLLIASMGGLAFDDANSHRDIKNLKKCLKYSENITTLCSGSNNKWLECLVVAEKLPEILEEQLQLKKTEDCIPSAIRRAFNE